MSKVTPRDREEKLLAAIAEGTTGNLPTPRNRKEKLLKEIYDNGSSGGGGTTNYNDLTNKPSINNVPLVGNLNTVNLKLTDPTLTEKGVPAEAKVVGTKLNELEGKYAKKDLYDDTTINVGRKADTRIGSNSTAEGYDTTASGYCSHAEGYDTTADGDCSHAEGQGTNANFDSQHVQGKYNIEDTESKYAHIVGNGTSKRKRSNAHTLDWEGNAWYAGDVINGNNVSLNGLQKDTEELSSNLGTLKTEILSISAGGSKQINVKNNGVILIWGINTLGGMLICESSFNTVIPISKNDKSISATMSNKVVTVSQSSGANRTILAIQY